MLKQLLLTASLILTSSICRADTFFDLTNGADHVTFSLVGGTTLSQTGVCAADPGLACAFDVPTEVNGASSQLLNVAFYDATDLGGLTIFDETGALLSQSGAVLFTGAFGKPNFTLGSFDLKNFSGFESTYQGDFRVTVSQTPEPGSLLLLGSGMLGCAIGYCHLRRRTAYAV